MISTALTLVQDYLIGFLSLVQRSLEYGQTTSSQFPFRPVDDFSDGARGGGSGIDLVVGAALFGGTAFDQCIVCNYIDPLSPLISS
jgi:hypothetical protein